MAIDFLGRALAQASTVVMIFLCSSCAFAQFHYEPHVVELSGTITSEFHYGPPGFGESPEIDQKMSAIILELDEPISVVAEGDNGLNSDSFDDVRAVQLVDAKEISLPEYLGQRLVIQGELFERHSGEHYTDVLMRVRKIERIE